MMPFVRAAWILALGACVVAENTGKPEVSFQEKLLATAPEGIDLEDALITFSPDGRSVAYWIRGSGQGPMMVGNRRGPDVDWVGAAVFSPDGRRLAYVARKAKKEFVVLGEEPGEEFDEVGKPSFSPDGKVLAYWAKRGDREFAVVGND